MREIDSSPVFKIENENYKGISKTPGNQLGVKVIIYDPRQNRKCSKEMNPSHRSSVNLTKEEHIIIENRIKASNGERLN